MAIEFRMKILCSRMILSLPNRDYLQIVGSGQNIGL